MKKKKQKNIWPAIVLIIMLGLYLYNNSKSGTETDSSNNVENLTEQNDNQSDFAEDEQIVEFGEFEIDYLTSEAVVLTYLKENSKLPDYYITKSEARKQGWIASKGNLCDVLPGKAIGGDVFHNRENKLPNKSGRKWFEADLNYNCNQRNADRLLYSSDGMIFVTYDHYNTFQKR